MDRVKEYIHRKSVERKGSLTARSTKSTITIEGKRVPHHHHQRNQNISHKKALLAMPEPSIAFERY
ncbi:hypothetical protein ALC57_11764 [Trachymyrmex cornetzi]|uniref:Uncharacterized protein n=1 Tax=Trachymyrmex cornetzi TaxID=471704 RepID=A0A151J1W7_9HYME|nr:hypothetical protein ALC57_11764 [Trachymyrmex cornetzi]